MIPHMFQHLDRQGHVERALQVEMVDIDDPMLHVGQASLLGTGGDEAGLFAGDLMRIWVLNTELEAKDPVKVPQQQAWIEADLPRYPDTKWKVAAYHKPMRPHTAGKQEGLSRIAAWAQLFYDHGVDLVVESDTHMVKRSYPLRPSDDEGSYESFIRDDENGVVFIGEGSWGAPTRPASR